MSGGGGGVLQMTGLGRLRKAATVCGKLRDMTMQP